MFGLSIESFLVLNLHLTVVALDYFVHDTIIDVCIILEICFKFSLLISLDSLLNVLEHTHQFFLFLELLCLVQQPQYLRWFIILTIWWFYFINYWMILFYLQTWLTSECLQGIGKWLGHFKSCNLILVSYGWMCSAFYLRYITLTTTAALTHYSRW